jgi:endonuclease YncB( thermonuclease family)
MADHFQRLLRKGHAPPRRSRDRPPGHSVRRKARRRRWRPSPIMVVAPLAILTVLWSGGAGLALPPARLPFDLPGLDLGRPAATPDRESAHFLPCSHGARAACVVDGDTFWYRGEKIRVADINTPETSEPGCAAEARLGERATRRLTELLNEGPFTLAAAGRETDRYGRTLRVVLRGGESLGTALVEEGLAEVWQGRRRDWC